MDPLIIYLILLSSGFALIGIEIFIPGGILGIIGSVFWVIAAFLGWNNFDYPYNGLSAFAIVILLILTIYVWIKFFPKSKIGKSLTLNDVIDESASYAESDLKIGDEGVAISTLRPAGIALINDQRLDVISDSSWVEKNSKIRVIDVQKGHIEVEKI